MKICRRVLQGFLISPRIDNVTARKRHHKVSTRINENTPPIRWGVIVFVVGGIFLPKHEGTGVSIHVSDEKLK